jgi:hypothetical protein
MRQLWIHRDVEILQGFMTRYLYSSRFCNKERIHITWKWNNIKKEMDEILKEMDHEVASKIECLNEPKKINAVPHSCLSPFDTSRK